MEELRYFKCIRNVVRAKPTFHVDVVSLYPTVNALDEYAVGYRRDINATVEDILQDRFVGLVRFEAIPNKNLKIHVLPDNANGTLLFHSNTMAGTWTALELCKALETGYKITQICAAASYTRVHDMHRSGTLHIQDTNRLFGNCKR